MASSAPSAPGLAPVAKPPPPPSKVKVATATVPTNGKIKQGARPMRVSAPPVEPRRRMNPLQRLAAAAIDAVEEGLVAGLLERGHALPRTADPAVQIAGNYAPVGSARR